MFLYVYALSVISTLQINMLLKNVFFPPASISFASFRVGIAGNLNFQSK